MIHHRLKAFVFFAFFFTIIYKNYTLAAGAGATSKELKITGTVPNLCTIILNNENLEFNINDIDNIYKFNNIGVLACNSRFNLELKSTNDFHLKNSKYNKQFSYIFKLINANTNLVKLISTQPSKNFKIETATNNISAEIELPKDNNFSNLPAGEYKDTVTITITPLS